MKNIIIKFCIGLSIIFIACHKDYLDKKPDKALVIPSTLSDFQALLDNDQYMNISPGLNVICSDEFYVDDEGWNSFYSEMERNVYLWDSDLYAGELQVYDWNYAYSQIFYSNIVLDGLRKIETSIAMQADYNRIKGGAHFFRAFALHNLSQLFAPVYQQETASSLEGIRFKESADIDQKMFLMNLQETYDQIITDLKLATELLPVQVPSKNRPNKAAAFGMLARVYLSMGKYKEAGQYASKSLELNSELLDYNSLDTNAIQPFPTALPNGNPEILFYASLLPYTFFDSPYTIVDSMVYQAYSAYDLRKPLLFSDKGGKPNSFKGTYSGTYPVFSGLATDEILLIKVECEAREGKLDEARESLNTLLSHRIQAEKFVEEAEKDQTKLIARIILERRKELIARGLRWSDLRRLNIDPIYQLKLTRIVEGKEYTLEPNDDRYIFPIPISELTP